MSSPIDLHIQRRASTPSDEAFLQQLYNSTRTNEMAFVPWPDAQKEAFLLTQFNAQTTQYWHAYPHSQHDIIELDDTAVGRLWINRSDTTIHILDITIHPDFRNKKIGSRMMRALITLSKSTAVPISLRVWQANLAAQRFYTRHQFTPVSEEGGYILMMRQPEAE